MRVYVDPSSIYAGLMHHMLAEGDVASDAEDADLVVTTPMVWPRPVTSSVPWPMGVEAEWYVSKLWNGSEFESQTIAGIPLLGMLSHGLGARVNMGCVQCCCTLGEQVAEHFERAELVELVKPMSPRYVSLLLSTAGEVVDVMTGIPGYGLYAAMELTDRKLSEELSDPRPLKDFWSTALLLSRFPWPHADGAGLITVPGVVTLIEKHVWFYGGKLFRNTYTTMNTKIAVVTAYSRVSLNDLIKRVERTAFNLDVKEKQFRTDGRRAARDVFELLVSKGMLVPSISGWFVPYNALPLD